MEPTNPLAASSSQSAGIEAGAAAPIATRAHTRKLARALGLGAAAVIAPIAIGRGIAAITGSRRAGWIAGALTLAVAGAARWQLQRWFADEPAYEVEQRIGKLEIRRYAPRVEARARISALSFDTALHSGFHRLASFIFGENAAHEQLAMTAPVLTTSRAETHTVAFVMPPERALDSLPIPDDDAIEVVSVPSRRVAVLAFRGNYRDEAIAEHTQQLLDLVTAAGLETTGQPTFAGFDPPTTLPLLRRNELWVGLAWAHGMRARHAGERRADICYADPP